MKNDVRSTADRFTAATYRYRLARKMEAPNAEVYAKEYVESLAALLAAIRAVEESVGG